MRHGQLVNVTPIANVTNRATSFDFCNNRLELMELPKKGSDNVVAIILDGNENLKKVVSLDSCAAESYLG